MNREVKVTKRVQTLKGPRYCPVVLSSNGHIKPDIVLVSKERGPTSPNAISEVKHSMA